MFSDQRMKSFDRGTLTLGNDASMNLTAPVKARQKSKVALDQAQAAGATLRVAKFDLQKRLLFAWSDYTLRAQEIALKREEVSLLGLHLPRGGGPVGRRLRAG